MYMYMYMYTALNTAYMFNVVVCVYGLLPVPTVAVTMGNHWVLQQISLDTRPSVAMLRSNPHHPCHVTKYIARTDDMQYAFVGKKQGNFLKQAFQQIFLKCSHAIPCTYYLVHG